MEISASTKIVTNLAMGHLLSTDYTVSETDNLSSDTRARYYIYEGISPATKGSDWVATINPTNTAITTTF